ncbi:ABC transporter substrate-binding protein [Pseudomonas putida]|uniref:ABC transporter substrate-binding protein n=1 Tax=Pseudomonas putida TaxID=303 RepID=UPI00335CCB06
MNILSSLNERFTFGLKALVLTVGLSAVHAQAVADNKKIVVADQNEIIQTMMRVSGIQKELGFNVEFANFAGGPAILEAFRGDALDVALVGSTPPVQAHVAGEHIPIIAAVDTQRPAYYFALKPGLEVRDLKALKGTKIAYAEGSARQTFVLAALQRGGLSPKDVTLVPLRVQDFPDAVRTGQVDVAPLIEPHFSRYVGNDADRDKRFIPIAATRGLPSHIQYLYANGKTLRDPVKEQEVRAFAAAWHRAYQWVTLHPQEWAKAYYQDQLGLDADDAKRIVQSDGPLVIPTLKSLVKAQQEIIDLIHGAGDIPKRLDAAEEFDFSFDAKPASAGGV